MIFLEYLISTVPSMPYEQSYSRQGNVLWTGVVPGIVIAVACFSISAGLYILIRKHKGLAGKSVIISLAACALVFGIVQLADVYTVLAPAYGIKVFTRLTTAGLCIITAVLLFRFMAVLRKLPCSAELQAINEKFDKQAVEKQESENKLAASNEKLAKNNKDLDEFAYIVSHDLKAPLRAISSLSQWIADDTKDTLPEETKKNIKLLLNRVHRMEDLISGILEYSRIGRIKSSLKKVELGPMLRDAVELLLPPPGFSIHIPNEMPVFTTDSVKLNQVFSCLLSNALKHHNNPRQGKVSISWEEDSRYFIFTVKDNGPGIAQEDQARMFLIFQTLQADKPGIGIGLAIVKKIVEGIGGQVWIEAGQEEGTEVKFTWPKELKNNA